MSDWTAGYVADVSYTYGYYAEMSVLRTKFALLANGIAPPSFQTACELGFGQGLSTNIHAASTQVEWYGTDFNPVQAGMAQEMARISGAPARLYDESFEEFCSRSDLPEFDFIALHGIWSWISNTNRQVIVDFIRRKLKVGGVVYVSYNTLPGWSSFAPMRHLLTQHAGVLGAEGQGIIGRVNGALDFAQKLVDTNPKFLKANPGVAERLTQVKGQNRQYLAHEYFNRDWHPMYFSDMAEWLASAKLDFGCTAFYLDQLDAINLTQEQQALVNGIPDEMLRQTVRDFMVNRQFRRDYWIKGKRPLTSLDCVEALRASKVLLAMPHGSVQLTMTGSLGTAKMNEKVYGPLLESLQSHEAKTLGQLESELKGKGVEFSHLVQAVMVLMCSGNLMPVQDDAVVAKAKKHTDNLNNWITGKARSDGEISFMASPVSGGGVPIGRFEQLFLRAMKLGKKQPAEIAEPLWQTLAQHGQKLVKEGKTLETPEENLAELTRQAEEFQTKRLPILKALKVA